MMANSGSNISAQADANGRLVSAEPAGTDITAFSPRRNQTAGPQVRRRRKLWPLTLGLCLTALALYYGVLCESRYVVESSFVIHSEAETTSVINPLAAFFKTGVVASGTDQATIHSWLQTASAIEILQREIDLPLVLSSRSSDFLWWLPSPALCRRLQQSGALLGLFGAHLDDRLTRERLARRLGRLANLSVNDASGVMTLHVESFTPDDGVSLSKAIIKMAAARLESMSQEISDKQLADAREEVARGEARVIEARNAMVRFQNERRDLSPTATGKGGLELLGKLEGELVARRGELAALRTTLRESTPQVSQVAAAIRELEAQTARIRGLMTSGADAVEREALNGVMADYQGLQMKADFAEKALVSVLAVYEVARERAQKQKKVLIIVSDPIWPDEPLMPERFLSFVEFAVLAMVLHAIFGLSLAILRDHKL